MTEFSPPKLLAAMIDAALAHRRNFKVHHHMGDWTSDPFVRFEARWLPDGTDVVTEVAASWSARMGSYRLRSATARGIYRDWHDITGKQALRLLTGEDCFTQRYTDIAELNGKTA